MLIDEIANARRNELNASALKIEYRRQWSEMKALERLEVAISRARGVLRIGPSPVIAR